MTGSRKMSMGLFVTCIVIIMTVDWMACDIFLPAQPDILEYFHTTASVLNSVLSVYFLISAVSVLLGGPISDKCGRKPVLLFGIILFCVSSFGCAAAFSVGFLVFCRAGAAFGAGLLTSVCMAMVKDYLSGVEFENAMAIVQSVIVLGPFVSPFLGSLMLILGSWRFVFIALGILSVVATLCAFMLPETLSEERRVKCGVLPAMKGLVTVVKDLNFSALLYSISLIGVPFFAFVAVCAYILMNDFGLSYIQYSIFYGGICLISFSAPFVYVFMNKRLSPKIQLYFCFALFGLSVLLLPFSKAGALVFFLVLIPYTYAEGISRPLGMVLLLNQHEDTTGAASALVGFTTSIIGTIGTIVATLSWTSYITGLFVVFLVCLVFSVLCWLFLLKRKVF